MSDAGAFPTILMLDAPEAPGAPEAERLHGRSLGHVVIERWVPGHGDTPWARADYILTWRTPVDAGRIAAARRCQAVIHYGPGAGRGVAPVALEAARTAGIYVASTPDYAPRAWAELALGWIEELLAASALPAGARSLAEGARLGLVGLGSVGGALAKLARTRRRARQGQEPCQNVWACDPLLNPEQFRSAGVHAAPLLELAGIAQALSLHVPLSPATRGMIGREALALMPRGGVLLNSSAPEIIDLEALAEVLGRAAGRAAASRPASVAFTADLAGVLPEGHPLLAHPAVRHGLLPEPLERPEFAWAARQAAADVIATLLHRARPAHLLIDPPCPRHVLWMAGLSWKD